MKYWRNWLHISWYHLIKFCFGQCHLPKPDHLVGKRWILTLINLYHNFSNKYNFTGPTWSVSIFHLYYIRSSLSIIPLNYYLWHVISIALAIYSFNSFFCSFLLKVFINLLVFLVNYFGKIFHIWESLLNEADCWTPILAEKR